MICLVVFPVSGLFGHSRIPHHRSLHRRIGRRPGDGLTATKAIRALNRPDAGIIPIIAMTANAFAEDVQRCLDAGMNAHLAKPLDIEKVKKTICEHTIELYSKE